MTTVARSFRAPCQQQDTYTGLFTLSLRRNVYVPPECILYEVYDSRAPFYKIVMSGSDVSSMYGLSRPPSVQADTSAGHLVAAEVSSQVSHSRCRSAEVNGDFVHHRHRYGSKMPAQLLFSRGSRFGEAQGAARPRLWPGSVFPAAASYAATDALSVHDAQPALVPSHLR